MQSFFYFLMDLMALGAVVCLIVIVGGGVSAWMEDQR